VEDGMSARADLLVRNGLVVSGHDARLADVAVRGERVLAVGDLGPMPAERVFDADGLLVLPGVIDVHNHPVYSDDLEQMCAAGARGGVTTVVPFIGAFPSWGFEKTTPLETAKSYVAAWDGRPACDFGVHMAIDSVDDLERDAAALVALGITSFKFFMAYRARGMMVDDDALIRNFDVVARHGGVAAVHAENGAGVSYLESRLWDEGEVDRAAFLECHTDLLEAEAILRAAALADAVGCPLYVPHVAVAEGLDVIAVARRASRSPVWAETCPHYLLLTNDAVLEHGSLAKIAPPLRAGEDSDRLWAGIAGGEVDVVATDHAARTRSVKAQGRNLLRQPYGAEGIEHLLPLLYTHGVLAGRFGLERLVRVLCENPADIFGLSPAKGRIAPGADADLVLIDPTVRGTVSAADHRTASDYCLYEGLPVSCEVALTVRRGVPTYDRAGEAVASGGGRFLVRAAPPQRRPALR
jgi:dihydropyrimidinase